MSVAVITGGTHGIGRALVDRAATSGWSVVFCGRSQPQEAAGERTIGVRADISVPEGVETVFATAVAAFGSIDAVVNCAGISGNSLLVNLEDSEWNAIRNTNLRGSVLVSQQAIRANVGALVLVGSTYQWGAPANAAYAASKGALWGLTRALSRQYPQTRTNMLVPGFVETRLTKSLSADARNLLIDRNPLRRSVTETEVAAAAMLLMDPPFSGQALHASGGVMEAPS